MPYLPLSTSPHISANEILARLIRLTAKTSGLSAILMLTQYSSPLVISLLLWLSKTRAKYRVGAGKGLARTAEGWGKLAGSAAEARIVMRLAGLLPIIQWLKALHPKPLQSILQVLKTRSLGSLAVGPKLVPIIQAWSLAVYYVAEHTWYLSSKGVLGLSPENTAKAGGYLMKGWAAYVIVEVYKIAKGYSALKSRSLKLRQSLKEKKIAQAEGFELQPTTESSSVNDLEKGENSTVGGVDDAEVSKLKNDWEDWALNAAQYFGYAPLTAHWCTPGGLGPMKNPNVSAALGTITAVASVLSAWKAA